MNVPVQMPQLGLTMTEGMVSEWLKNPGDEVRKNEVFFVVSTDKVDMEVESSVDGTLAQIVIESGRVVPVGTVVAYIEQPDKAAVTAQASVQSPAPQPSPERPAAQVPTTREVVPVLARTDRRLPRVSPRARKLARDLGIDLAKVQGSGLGGRIVEADVRRSVEPSAPGHAFLSVARRELIAELMTESIRTIPHFSVTVEVNAQQLIRLRESLKQPLERATGLKLTFTDLLLKALGIAVRQTPQLNRTWGEIAPRDAIHLGLAVATERAVVAPVIRNADRIDLAELVTHRHDLTERARQGKLSLVDLEGGVGTLSNLGMRRVDCFQAIITPGQTFVVSVGRIANRPWVETILAIRPTVVLTLSVDHRIADGAEAATLLEMMAENIENPYRILWNPASLDPGGRSGVESHG